MTCWRMSGRSRSAGWYPQIGTQNGRPSCPAAGRPRRKRSTAAGWWRCPRASCRSARATNCSGSSAAGGTCARRRSAWLRPDGRRCTRRTTDFVLLHHLRQRRPPPTVVVVGKEGTQGYCCWTRTRWWPSCCCCCWAGGSSGRTDRAVWPVWERTSPDWGGSSWGATSCPARPPPAGWGRRQRPATDSASRPSLGSAGWCWTRRRNWKCRGRGRGRPERTTKRTSSFARLLAVLHPLWSVA